MTNQPTSTTCLPPLAVVDAENLDRARIHSGLTTRLGDRRRATVPPHPSLTTFVGADASRYRAMVREFPHDQCVIGFGPDGGELALIEVIERRALDGEIGCLVIGSGDGEFTPVAWRARSLGLVVVVVALDDCLFTSLARMAHHTIAFPEPAADRSAAHTVPTRPIASAA